MYWSTELRHSRKCDCLSFQDHKTTQNGNIWAILIFMQFFDRLLGSPYSCVYLIEYPKTKAHWIKADAISRSYYNASYVPVLILELPVVKASNDIVFPFRGSIHHHPQSRVHTPPSRAKDTFCAFKLYSHISFLLILQHFVLILLSVLSVYIYIHTHTRSFTQIFCLQRCGYISKQNTASFFFSSDRLQTGISCVWQPWDGNLLRGGHFFWPLTGMNITIGPLKRQIFGKTSLIFMVVETR